MYICKLNFNKEIYTYLDVQILKIMLFMYFLLRFRDFSSTGSCFSITFWTHTFNATSTSLLFSTSLSFKCCILFFPKNFFYFFLKFQNFTQNWLWNFYLNSLLLKLIPEIAINEKFCLLIFRIKRDKIKIYKNLTDSTINL